MKQKIPKNQRYIRDAMTAHSGGKITCKRTREEAVSLGLRFYRTDKDCPKCGDNLRTIKYHSDGTFKQTICTKCTQIAASKKPNQWGKDLSLPKCDKAREELEIKRLEEGDYWDDL